MNTLVLASDRPHRPAGGYALRVLQNIRALALLGPVDVMSVGVEDPAEVVEGVRDWVPFSIRTHSTWGSIKSKAWPLRPGVYPGVDLYHSTTVQRHIQRATARRGYDVAVIEGILMSSYLDDLKRGGCRVVFDAHNIEDKLHEAVVQARSGPTPSLVQRAKDRVLRRRMTQTEKQAILAADVLWACSERDAREIERVYETSTPVMVVPNGVDVETYRRAGAPQPADDWSDVPITLLYPGLFRYSPNEDAALRLVREVLPAVRARGYRARVVLVGREPTPAMSAAAKQDPWVTVTGTVESVLPYLEQPCVVTLPLMLGSGTRLKIVEAFAVGRPVVSTAKGAEGIDAVDGEHLLIRDDVDAMAAAVIDLWNRPGLRTHLCTNAHHLVRTRYSWSVAATRIAHSLVTAAGGVVVTPVADQPTRPEAFERRSMSC
jgi:glycosyltransferase involved in cell wall biosynthesis